MTSSEAFADLRATCFIYRYCVHIHNITGKTTGTRKGVLLTDLRTMVQTFHLDSLDRLLA